MSQIFSLEFVKFLALRSGEMYCSKKVLAPLVLILVLAAITLWPSNLFSQNVEITRIPSIPASGAAEVFHGFRYGSSCDDDKITDNFLRYVSSEAFFNTSAYPDGSSTFMESIDIEACNLQINFLLQQFDMIPFAGSQPGGTAFQVDADITHDRTITVSSLEQGKLAGFDGAASIGTRYRVGDLGGVLNDDETYTRRIEICVENITPAVGIVETGQIIVSVSRPGKSPLESHGYFIQYNPTTDTWQVSGTRFPLDEADADAGSPAVGEDIGPAVFERTGFDTGSFELVADVVRKDDEFDVIARYVHNMEDLPLGAHTVRMKVDVDVTISNEYKNVGDVNRDGVINFGDIAPFVKLLSTNTYSLWADFNCDGVVDFADISLFIQALIGN